jgi:hypothetical protein
MSDGGLARVVIAGAGVAGPEALLVAVGARPQAPYAAALTFRGPGDVAVVSGTLHTPSSTGSGSRSRS